MTLTIPNTFIDGPYTDLGTQVMSDFAQVATIANDLTGVNFIAAAVVACAGAEFTGTVAADSLIAPSDSDIVVAVASFAGHKFRIVDSSNTVLYQVMSDLGIKVG